MTATKTLTPGTIVRAPRYQNGQSTGHRRGIILGTFAGSGDPKSGYLVWFYTLGPAHEEYRGNTETVGVVFPREITSLGTVEDMSMRTLTKLGRGLRDWDTGRKAWNAMYCAYANKRRAATGA